MNIFKSAGRLSLNAKILILALAPLFIFDISLIYMSYTTTRDSLIEERKVEIKNTVKMSEDLLKSLVKKVEAKKMTLEDAKKFAADYLTDMRYGADGDDYVWVNDLEPRMIIHPSEKLRGKSMKDFRDKAGLPLFTEIVKLVKKQDEGLISYVWVSKKDPNVNASKLSYVKLFKPWNWVIGTGIYMDDVEDHVINVLFKELIFAFIGLLIIGAGIFIIVKRQIADPLLSIANRLSGTSRNVTSGADETYDAASTLSKSTQEQASSVQQTVSSIDEISAMVDRSSDYAKESRETSLTSQRAAEDGKSRVDEMLTSIHEITASNEDAMRKMEESNSQISEILSVIKEIDDKTNVINDIVFQTKLLAFNASVEAARAGEMGKGFAVVAEEVGSLASMSGKASEEIKSLIDQSIKRVEDIVSNTTNMVEVVMKEGASTVEKGTLKANECKSALDEILENVKGVNQKVGEISQACQEQSTGVGQITDAMRLLDSVTNENNQVANSASRSAEVLRDQANELDRVVDEVKDLVMGH